MSLATLPELLPALEPAPPTERLPALQDELASPDAAPLERLLVGRITACWLALHYAEATAPRMHGATPAQHRAAQKRIGMQQTRYVQAIKALATLRKLLRPAPAPLEIATWLARNPTAWTFVNTAATSIPPPSGRRSCASIRSAAAYASVPARSNVWNTSRCTPASGLASICKSAINTRWPP